MAEARRVAERARAELDLILGDVERWTSVLATTGDVPALSGFAHMLADRLEELRERRMRPVSPPEMTVTRLTGCGPVKSLPLRQPKWSETIFCARREIHAVSASAV